MNTKAKTDTCVPQGTVGVEINLLFSYLAKATQAIYGLCTYFKFSTPKKNYRR